MATLAYRSHRVSSFPPAKPDGIVKTFEHNILDALRAYQSNIKKEILPESQNTLQSQDFAGFLKYMGSEDSNAQAPPILCDYKLPLSSYYISTSHNTYLTGNQLYGKATVDGYKNVLLRGCRCVEIDCWDGGSANGEGHAGGSTKEACEPIVLHGHTATREISFRSVCETIRDYAFVASDLPVIVSLEVHTSHQQQQIMVDIMESCFKDYLCPLDTTDDDGNGPVLPSPDALRKKILIKVKYSPPNAKTGVEDENLLEHADTHISELSEEDSHTKEPGKPAKKPSKIIEALSQMGIYTRSYHYSGLKSPQASIPTHVFSLSESTLIGVHKSDPEGLFDHNKKFMMRAYPKGVRIDSSNLDPSLFWRIGVQMVALNWQRIDKGMMLQEGMFESTGGWAPKPQNHLSTANYKDSIKHLSQGNKSWLRITLLAGQNIPSASDTDKEDKLRPYVKCEIHLDVEGQLQGDTSGSNGSVADRFRKNKDLKFKKQSDVAKTRHPKFGNRDILNFGSLPSLVPELSFARFKVMHDKFGPDEFLAWACIRLDRLRPGIRFIHLYDANGQANSGVLLAKIDYEWNVEH